MEQPSESRESPGARRGGVKAQELRKIMYGHACCERQLKLSEWRDTMPFSHHKCSDEICSWLLAKKLLMLDSHSYSPTSPEGNAAGLSGHLWRQLLKHSMFMCTS